VTSRRRTGSVATGGRAAAPAEDRLHAIAEDLAVQARASGVDDEAVLALVRAALARERRPPRRS
jgi:hypothetical protein